MWFSCTLSEELPVGSEHRGESIRSSPLRLGIALIDTLNTQEAVLAKVLQTVGLRKSFTSTSELT